MAESSEISELKLTVKKLTEENISLKRKIKDMRSVLLPALGDNDQEGGEDGGGETGQETKLMPIGMPYDDVRFFSPEERKDLKFEIFSDDLSYAQYDDLNPAMFYKFEMKNKDKENTPQPISKFVKLKYGRFTTPIAGDYRFDIKGHMWCHYEDAKADWYICYVPQQYDTYNDNDDDSSYDGSSDDEEDSDEKKKKKEEKEKLFQENKKQQLLFQMNLEKTDCEFSVGVKCDKGVVFWVEVVILADGFYNNCNECTFSGRLVR